jgi:LysM repeat protein
MALLMTAKEFINKVKEVQKTNTVYMWGTYGQVLTNQLIDYKANQYPSKNTPARVARHKKLVGQGYSAWDCVGLIKGILWGWEYGKSPKYKGSEVPDVGSDSMYKNYTTHQSTDFKDILPGEVVWIVGHIGVYIGDGLVIEATSRNKDGFTDNVLISALGNHGAVKGYPTRSWTHHGRLKWIDYAAVPKPDPKPEPTPKPEGDYLEHKVVKGDTPWGLAQKYLGKGARYTEIMDLNGLKHDATIYAGQVLKIPVDCPPSESEKPKTYDVRVNTARGLNVRSAPVNGSVLRTLPNGVIVTISKEDKRPSRTWGYVEAYKGWIALDFTLPVSAPAPPAPPIKEYKVRVNTKNGLNVRKEPKASSKVVKVLGNGTKVVIMEEEKEGSRTWGLAKNQNGWIALDFTVKV